MSDRVLVIVSADELRSKPYRGLCGVNRTVGMKQAWNEAGWEVLHMQCASIRLFNTRFNEPKDHDSEYIQNNDPLRRTFRNTV